MVWGTHSGAPIRIMGIMNGSGEQELHELTRLKHHSHRLKTNGYYLKFFNFRIRGSGGSNPLSPTIIFNDLTAF
jgi:hypothetical protein